jgi:ketosteroid isomerase-like protein
MTDTHATDPAGLVAAYLATFGTGDGESLDRHYEPGAVLVPRPGQPLVGAAQRITAHNHLLSLGLPMRAQARHVYLAGDIALLIVDWSVSGVSANGHPVELGGTAADVARRAPDGRWRYVIDNPFGTG